MDNSKLKELSGGAWDEDRSIHRMGGEKALIKRIAVLFLRDTPIQLAQALLGIEQMDYDLCYVPMHTLKGASSNFCTRRLEMICSDLLIALKDRNWNLALIMHQALTSEYHLLEEQMSVFINDDRDEGW